MPGAVLNTSTHALTNVTQVRVALANQGRQDCVGRRSRAGAGLNIAAGKVPHRSASEAHNLPLVADWHELVSA